MILYVIFSGRLKKFKRREVIEMILLVSKLVSKFFVKVSPD